MIRRRSVFSRFLKFLMPLDRKLVRGIANLRGQVIAVSLVVGCGVTLYVMMNGSLASLENTRDAYYDRYQMAHVWAPVRRAPMTLVQKAADIPGVRLAAGRITARALLDMPGEAEPVIGRVVSVPDGRMPDINNLYIVKGVMPAQGMDEVALLRSFADAHKLELGDTIEATLYGVRRVLRITAIALSPEFIYSMPPGEIIPNPRRNAIMWMGYEALAHAYNMNGAFNDLNLLLERDAAEDDILNRIDILLEPYGNVGAYTRADHISDEFLRSELDQLKNVGGLLPPIFLGVAAYLLNIIVTRIVEDEREQIGLMKAFGYTPMRIAVHYLKFAIVIISIGVILGWIAGARMGRGMSGIYQEFYSFPLLIFNPGSAIFIKAGLVALIAGLLGVLLAVRKVIGLRPAVAMAPPPPTDYSGVAAIGKKLKWMDQGLRLIIRHILRWPVRAALTCLGISLGMTIMIGAQGGSDALDRMMVLQFEQVSRQDLTVYFTEPRDRTIVHTMLAMDGIIEAEPFYMAPATFIHENHSRHQGLYGVVMDARLNLLLDEDDKPVNPPADGIVMEKILAEALGLEPGDTVTVKIKTGSRPTLELPVLRTVSTYLGTPTYIEMGRLQRYMNAGDEVSGVYLNVDTSKLDQLYRQLKEMPGVMGVNANKTSYASMREQMDKVMGTMLFFNSLFASLIAIGVVYSSARISFFERQREIASLRVLGFTLGEVNAVLLGELALLTILALPLGAYLGWHLAIYLAETMSSELFRMPKVVALKSFGYAASVIVLASLFSAGLMARQVAKLELVVALKTKE